MLIHKYEAVIKLLGEVSFKTITEVIESDKTINHKDIFALLNKKYPNNLSIALAYSKKRV